MASLTPGYTWAGREIATPSKFHQQISSAYIINVANADLSPGFKLFHTTTPGTPATGDVRVGSDGLLEFFFGGVWNVQPPNALALTLTNKSGSNLVTGDVVVPDPTNADSFTIAAVSVSHVIGVLGANIANNASGIVYVRGVVQVKVLFAGSPFSLPGAVLIGPNGTLGTTDLKTSAQPSLSTRSNAFGIMLEKNDGPTNDIVTCFIWK